MPNGSISRVYYSGHAGDSGLMLNLGHSSACEAQAMTADMVLNDSILRNKNISNKFDKTSKSPSKFYGCYTKSFAKQWKKTFGVNAEGAENKIDFSVIDKASNTPNVFKRIEDAPTSHGPTDWAQY